MEGLREHISWGVTVDWPPRVSKTPGRWFRLPLGLPDGWMCHLLEAGCLKEEVLEEDKVSDMLNFRYCENILKIVIVGSLIVGPRSQKNSLTGNENKGIVNHISKYLKARKVRVQRHTIPELNLDI